MKTSTCPRRMFVLLALFVFASQLFAEVRLPRLFGDGMVLQRDTDVLIWGWATPGESVTVRFDHRDYFTSADDAGRWKVNLGLLQAGGPYIMTVQATNHIIINDILVGDVWICSGQSNMELPMSRVSWVYPQEIADANNHHIRQFVVPQTYDFNQPKDDFNGGVWKPATRENIAAFTAVGYFFASEIYRYTKVPVGLINNALGGSPAEAWMSEEALRRFPAHYNEMQKFKDTAYVNRIIRSDNQRINSWYSKLLAGDKLANEVRIKTFDQIKTGYQLNEMNVPGYWTGTPLAEVNGSFWFFKEILLSAEQANQPAELILGCIVDADSVFINGKFVGNTTYKYPPRRYKIPAGTLRPGNNTLTIRIISSLGVGGFVPDKEYTLHLGKEVIDLQGRWHYLTGCVQPPLQSQTFVRWKPGGLYNALLHPLINYKIKGVIWYQGESNTGRPIEYRRLFPALISNWREDFRQGDFPFLFVQLASFMDPPKEPAESNWAMLREAQSKTLEVPNTAMVVTIDIGEWNDIHPLNKKDVGHRLALAARNVAYGDKATVYSGPVPATLKIRGRRVILTFDHPRDGLKTNDGKPLRQIAIAGEDKKFYWAEAAIRNNRVVVWNDSVRNPVAVRYAWADNPEGANLCNQNNLPASPFRTDSW